MTIVRSIRQTIHADSCGDDETAAAFCQWAEEEMERRYPDASVQIDVSYNTSGTPFAPQIDADDEEAADDVADELRTLWSDWERAGWPGAAA